MSFNEKTDILATYTTQDEDGYNHNYYLLKGKNYLFRRGLESFELARMGDAFFQDVFYKVTIIDEGFFTCDSTPYAYFYRIRTKKDFGCHSYIQVDMPNGLTFWIEESTQGRTITKEEIELFKQQCFGQESLTYNQFLSVYSKLWEEPVQNHDAIQEMYVKYEDYVEQYFHNLEMNEKESHLDLWDMSQPVNRDYKQNPY
tara:strand:+ start:3678 stop:4277 length:600 start_codon:yes stop_codon:yes gene_type:complete